jgi:DNA helicase-2/ATP-dependent DNA helicase PcrA
MVLASRSIEAVPRILELPRALPFEPATDLLGGLNREQRAAVTHTTGPALVVAGPGTGKTEVVTRRVAWLIATRRARPREILALTFTDNAAQEMQARVDVLVPYGQADAAIHTFHAFGDKLLREHALELGLPSDVRLVNRSELIVFLRGHLFELGLNRYMPLGDPERFLGALIDLFGRAKDEDVSAGALAEHVSQMLLRVAHLPADERPAVEDLAEGRAELARAFEAYNRLLGEAGLIDHSDQVALPLRLLRERAAVRAAVAGRYRFVLVDELQDTNKAQLELVLALSGSGNVMAVGDPDQGIYGFRGARTGNVERFRSLFPRVRPIALRRNYRSLAPVIEAATRAIAINRAASDLRRPAQRADRRARGGGVRRVTFATPEAEADGVAAEIARRVATGARPSEFAVLVRANHEVDEFARSLRVRGIRVDAGSPARLLDVPLVRSLLALLRVTANPDDSLEMYALAAGIPYGLQPATLAALLAGARRRNRSLWQALVDSVESGDDRLSQDDRKRALELIDHVRAAIAQSADATTGEVLYGYLRQSGLLLQLARSTDAREAASARSVARFCELVRARSSLLELDRVAFLAPAFDIRTVEDDSDDDADQEDAVRVLTVHRAKGLEFGTVFICGLVEGRFPVRSRPPVLALPDELVSGEHADEAALAEERRLFYVALTRARNEVWLTSHENGPRGRGRRRPSPFIAEALDVPAARSVPDASSRLTLEQILLTPVASDRTPVAGGPLTLSFSQIDEFLTCPERYRLRYDIGIPTPAHHALSYGNAIHQAIAAFHTAQSEGRTLTDDELVDVLRRHWQPDGFLSREHEDARFEAGSTALRRFRAQQIALGSRIPAAIERPFTFRIGQDKIRGRVDRIDPTAEGAVITDYKSSDVREQKHADAKARDSLQLQVYALAHQAETGELPARVQLHFVESGVVGSAAPSADRLDKARVKLTQAADDIRARRFEPKPSTVACGYCPFRTICSSSAA